VALLGLALLGRTQLGTLDDFRPGDIGAIEWTETPALSAVATGGNPIIDGIGEVIGSLWFGQSQFGGGVSNTFVSFDNAAEFLGDPEFSCTVNGEFIQFDVLPMFVCTASSNTAYSFQESPVFEVTVSSPIRVDAEFSETPVFLAFISLAVSEDCLTGDGVSAGESGIPNFVF